MAQNTMIGTGEGFDLEVFSKRLAGTYQQKGFTVQVASTANTATIVFDKNTGGINMLLGLGLGITANCMLSNGTLVINYTNADWTGKIVGLAVGWILCFVPFITAIIGCVKQSGLAKEIGNDAVAIASSLGN